MDNSDKIIEVTLCGQKHKVGVKAHRYTNNKAPALALVDMGEMPGAPFGKLSVNLAKLPSPGCIWLKDWSENEELVAGMLEEGYFEPTGRVLEGTQEVKLTEKLRAVVLNPEELDPAVPEVEL